MYVKLPLNSTCPRQSDGSHHHRLSLVFINIPQNRYLLFPSNSVYLKINAHHSSFEVDFQVNLSTGCELQNLFILLCVLFLKSFFLLWSPFLVPLFGLPFISVMPLSNFLSTVLILTAAVDLTTCQFFP